MKKQKSTLKRTVNTKMLALYGIGNIVGAGVYVLIGKIAGPAGYLSILSFGIAAMVAFCSALSYAELAGRYPVSAGVSVYLHEAFRAKRLSTILGIMLVIAGLISSATLVRGFAGYFYSLIPWNQAIVMIGVLVILLLISLKGIKESVVTAALFTIIEVGGLFFLIFSIISAQPEALASFGEKFTVSLSAINATALAGVISGAFIAFYAFVGFEDMVNLAEEVKEPKKAFPRAILASMLLVSVLYTLVAITTLSVLTPDALSTSNAPLAQAYEVATNRNATIIVAISLVATLNGVLANVIMGSRFLYGLAKKRWIPTWFAGLSKRNVPARGLVVATVIAGIFALWLPIEKLAQLTSLLLLFVFFAVNISLIVIRRQHPKTAKNLQISPTALPWIGTFASAGLLGGQVVTMIL